MVAVRVIEDKDDADVDHIVVLRGATWADFQRTQEVRGEHSVPRLAFSHGELQIMSPSRTHESLKSVIGMLVEAYCYENAVDFTPIGSWTLERKDLDRGLEPDECYVFGTHPEAQVPDLAIEVIWTSGGLNKLEIYRALGVKEVWVWRRACLVAHVLRGDRYVESSVSEVLPGLDLAHLASFIERPTASQSIREYRAALRS